jgi:hypothetical protein
VRFRVKDSASGSDQGLGLKVREWGSGFGLSFRLLIWAKGPSDFDGLQSVAFDVALCKLVPIATVLSQVSETLWDITSVRIFANRYVFRGTCLARCCSSVRRMPSSDGALALVSEKTVVCMHCEAEHVTCSKVAGLTVDFASLCPLPQC